MNIAAKAGEELRRKHTISGFFDLDAAIANEGLEVVSFAFAGSILEVLYNGCIGLAPNISTAEKRPLLAHALAHQLLHNGDQIFITTTDVWWARKTERQANIFAAHLLIPDDELIICLRSKETVWGLAEKYEVPEWFTKERLELLRQERPELWQVT